MKLVFPVQFCVDWYHGCLKSMKRCRNRHFSGTPFAETPFSFLQAEHGARLRYLLGVDFPQTGQVPKDLRAPLTPALFNPIQGGDLRAHALNPPWRRLRRRPQGRFAPLGRGGLRGFALKSTPGRRLRAWGRRDPYPRGGHDFGGHFHVGGVPHPT